MDRPLTHRPGPAWAVPALPWTTGRIAISIGLIALIAVAVLSLGEAGRLVAAAHSLVERPDLLILFLGTYTLAFYARAVAWRVLLPTGAPGTFRLWRLLQIALLANHLFPTKAGEAIRVALIARHGVSLGAATASTGLARLLDFAALCLIAALAGTWAGVGPDRLLIGLSLPLAGVTAGLLGWLALRHGTWPGSRLALPAWATARLSDLQRGVAAVGLPRLAVAGTLVVPSWLLEAGALWSMAQAAGVPVSPVVAIAATAGAIAFQAFQFTPGGIGLYEISLTGALTLMGIDPATGLTLALGTHGLKFAYAYAVGFPCLLAEGIAGAGLRRVGRWFGGPRAPRSHWLAGRSALAHLTRLAISPLGSVAGAITLVIALDLLAGRLELSRLPALALGAATGVPLAVLGRCHHLPRALTPVLLIPPLLFIACFGLPAPAAGLVAIGVAALIGLVRGGLSPTTVLWPGLIVQSVVAGADRPLDTAAFGLGALAAVVMGRQWWLSHRPLPPGGPVPPGRILAVIVPAHNEAPTVGSIVRDVPRTAIKALGYPAVVIVIDDGSTDESGAIARDAGADLVIRHPTRRGLGAALRTGLLAAGRLGAGTAVYLDGDGEYSPRDIPAVAGPVLRGEADYVLGSRFPAAGRVMRPSRRIGNLAFTALVGVLSGRRIADAQTGFRAFSARALARAEIVHDYNYAQVLTLDLLRKRQRLAEVPIAYEVRRQGRSFIRYREYLSRVLPAIAREVLRP